MSKPLRLGIFIVAALVMFGAGVFWIGGRELRFASTYKLNADFDNVAGLGEGATVRVGGIHEGVVHKIFLPNRPDQQVRVEMEMRKATRNVVKKDSVAAIRTEGLVGDQYVEVSFGSVDVPQVENGDTIRAEAPLQVSDMLKKMNGMLDSAQGAVASIGQTAGNLAAVSSKVNSGQGTAGALVNDRSMYQHVNEAAANLQEDTEALKHNFLLRGFFKKRGYEDSTELARNAVTALPSGTPQNRLSYPGSKLFDGAESAKIKNGKQLDEAGKYLEQAQYGVAVIACYADQKGDSDKQLQLTRARATTARDYLVQHFKIDDKRVKIFGGGKSADSPDGGDLQVLVYAAASENTADRVKKEK